MNSCQLILDGIEEQTQTQQKALAKPEQHLLYNSMGISPITKVTKCSAEQLLNSGCTSTTTSQSISPVRTPSDKLCIVEMDQKSQSVESQFITNGNNATPSVILQISEDINSDKNWKQLTNTLDEKDLTSS